MQQKLQEWTQQPVIRFLVKCIGDPVQLYAVFLVTTIMYYYHSSMTWLYTLTAIFVSWVMMRFYDFISKHKWIGPLVYLVYVFAGLEIVGMITNYGSIDYPISFLVWFLTPQSVVTFSIWYTIAVYLLMLGFLTSIVYYFSKIRYRMTMQFLIMLIPLSLYAKEGIQMPGILVMVLLASYFLLMIYCRQIHNEQEIRYLASFQGNLSIAVYVIAFSVIASVIPKPQVTADREFIENAMSYSSWSDVLMNAISMFTDTTDNSVAFSDNTRTLYYVWSEESLRLRTQTYSYYQADDSWTVLADYDKPENALSVPLTYAPRDLLQAILDAAALDTAFAETYGLEELTNLTLPAQEAKTVYIYTRYTTQILPSPTRTIRISGTVDISDILQSAANTFGGTNFTKDITAMYYSDTYAGYEAVRTILQKLNHETYCSLLSEAYDILENVNPEQAELLMTVRQEAEEADTYLHLVNSYDFQSETITQLAEEITAGLESDYDKAKAIETYFTKQGFVYDSAYIKASGENAEYFLTHSKTGVCYEFATAMVLLCRSIGLPARYVQGYNLSELYDNKVNGMDTNYLIKVRDAHAFPEVYISGYGWLSFEPTVASYALQDDDTANQSIMHLGFAVLLLAVLTGIFYFQLPHIREAVFRKRILHMTSQQSAAAVFQHMRRMLRLPDSTTVSELESHSLSFCQENAFFQELDVLLYSHATEQSMTSEQLAEAYIRWQAAFERFLKEEAQKRKNQAKAKRKER